MKQPLVECFFDIRSCRLYVIGGNCVISEVNLGAGEEKMIKKKEYDRYNSPTFESEISIINKKNINLNYEINLCNIDTLAYSVKYKKGTFLPSQIKNMHVRIGIMQNNNVIYKDKFYLINQVPENSILKLTPIRQ